MQDDGKQGGGSVSIGEEDQRRDREMLRELRDEDAQQDDLPDTAPGARPSQPTRSEDKDRGDADWHPGEAEQPVRATSEGLTGRGPSQPDP